MINIEDQNVKNNIVQYFVYNFFLIIFIFSRKKTQKGDFLRI